MNDKGVLRLLYVLVAIIVSCRSTTELSGSARKHSRVANGDKAMELSRPRKSPKV
jgi:hypothetical protein